MASPSSAHSQRECASLRSVGTEPVVSIEASTSSEALFEAAGGLPVSAVVRGPDVAELDPSAPQLALRVATTAARTASATLLERLAVPLGTREP